MFCMSVDAWTHFTLGEGIFGWIGIGVNFLCVNGVKYTEWKSKFWDTGPEWTCVEMGSVWLSTF